MSIWHWIIVLAIILVLFGRGRIADVMGDVAKGVRNFKRGLADDEPATAASAPAKAGSIDHRPAEVIATEEKKTV